MTDKIWQWFPPKSAQSLQTDLQYVPSCGSLSDNAVLRPFIPFCWVFICKGLFTHSGVLPRIYNNIFTLCGFPPSVICSVEPVDDLTAPSLHPSSTADSDNSLLRYLSDDKILVIEEEPEGPGRESRRDSTRRSRRKSRNPSSPSFPISPSMLSSTLRLDQPPDALPVCTQSSF